MSLFDLLTRPFSRAPAASTSATVPAGQAAPAAPTAPPGPATPSWSPAPAASGWQARAAATAEGGEADNQAQVRTAVKPQDTPQKRGVLAARALDDTRVGIDKRMVALNAANGEVQRSETDLGRQLYALAPGLTPEQRQRFADAYRARHHEVYDRASDAAHDLARYVRDQAPALPQAVADLAGHPVQNVVTMLPSQLQGSLDAAADVLATYAHQAPKADAELQRTLRDIGGRYGAIKDPQTGALPGNSPAGLNVTPRGALSAAGETFDFVGRMTRFGEVAEDAGNAFGVLAGVAGAVNNAQRVADGRNTTASAIGLGGNALEIAGGVAVLGGVTIAGVSIGVPLAIAGGIIAGGAQLYNTLEDNGQAQRALIDTLQASGLDAAHASSLAKSNPASLRKLGELGLTAGQIGDLSAAAPGVVSVHQSQADDLIAAGRLYGLGPDQLIAVARELQQRGAVPDIAFNSWIRVLAGSPGIDPVRLLDQMRRGFEANDSSRVLADLLKRP